MAGAVTVLVLLAAWVVLARTGTDGGSAPAVGQASPSAGPATPPAPGPGAPGPESDAVPESMIACADADDWQVYARPYTPPTSAAGPRPSATPLACPAV